MTVVVELARTQVEVPLVSLVPDNALESAECEIDFDIDLNFDKEAKVCLSKLRINKMAIVKIKFAGCDQAEGLARIGDVLVKQIPTI